MHTAAQKNIQYPKNGLPRNRAIAEVYKKSKYVCWYCHIISHNWVQQPACLFCCLLFVAVVVFGTALVRSFLLNGSPSACRLFFGTRFVKKSCCLRTRLLRQDQLQPFHQCSLVWSL
jgi:hypothetical protein